MMSWLQTQSTNQLLPAEATAFDTVDPATLLDVYYNAQDSVYINRQGLQNTELCWRQIRGYSQNSTFIHYIDQFNLVPTTKYPTNLFQIKSDGTGASQVAAGTAYGVVTVVPTTARPPGYLPNGNEDELGYTTPPVYFGLPYVFTLEIGGRDIMYVSDLESQFPYGNPTQYAQILPSINPVAGTFPTILGVIIPGEILALFIRLYSAKNHIWRGKTLLANTQNSPLQKLTGGIVTEVYNKLATGEQIFDRLYEDYLPFPPWEYKNPQGTCVIYSTRMVEKDPPYKITGPIGATSGNIFGAIRIETPCREFEYKRPMSYGVQWYILGLDSDKFYGPTNETDEIKLETFPYFKVKKTPAEDVIVVIAVYIVIDTADSYDPMRSSTAPGTQTYIVTHGIHTIGGINSPGTQLTILEAGGVVGNLSVFGYTMEQIGASTDNSYIVVEEATGIMVYALSKVHVSIPGGEFILTGEHTKTNFTTKNVIALIVGQSSITATQTSTTTSITTTAIKYFAISGEPMNRIAEEIHLDEYKFYLFQRSNGVYKTLKEIIGAYVQIMANDSSATGTLMVSGIKITSPIGEQMPNVSEVEYHHIQIEIVVFAPSLLAPFALSLPNTSVVPAIPVNLSEDEATFDLTKLLPTVRGLGLVSGNFTQIGNLLEFFVTPTVTTTISNFGILVSGTNPQLPQFQSPLVSMLGSMLKITRIPTLRSAMPFIGDATLTVNVASSLLGTFEVTITLDYEEHKTSPIIAYSKSRVSIDLSTQFFGRSSDPNVKIGGNLGAAAITGMVNDQPLTPLSQEDGSIILQLTTTSKITIDPTFTTAVFDIASENNSLYALVNIKTSFYGGNPARFTPQTFLAIIVENPTPITTYGPRSLLAVPFDVEQGSAYVIVDGVSRDIVPIVRSFTDWIPEAIPIDKPKWFVVAKPTDTFITVIKLDSSGVIMPLEIKAYQCQHVTIPATVTIDRFAVDGVKPQLTLSVNDPPLMPVVLNSTLGLAGSLPTNIVIPATNITYPMQLRSILSSNQGCAIIMTIKIRDLNAISDNSPIYGIAPVDIAGRTTDVSVATLCPIESFEKGTNSPVLGYDTRNLFIQAQTAPSPFPATSDSYIFLRQSDGTYKRHPFFLAIYLPPILKWIALGQGLSIPPNTPVSVNGQWIAPAGYGDDTLSDTAQDMVLVGGSLTATKPTNAIVVVGSVAYNLRFFTPMSPQTTFVISKTNRGGIFTVKIIPNIKFTSRDAVPPTNRIMTSTTSPANAMVINILSFPPTIAGAYLTKFTVSQYDSPLAESWDCIAIVDDGSSIAQTVVAIASGRTQIRIFKTYDLTYSVSPSQFPTRPYDLNASRFDITSNGGGDILETSQGFIVKPQAPSVFVVTGTAYFDSSYFPNLASGSPPFPPIDLPFAIKVVVVPSPANTVTNFCNVIPSSDQIPQLDNKPWLYMQAIGDSQTATVSSGGIATYATQSTPFYNEYIGTDTSGITTRIRMVGINVPIAYIVGQLTNLPPPLQISTTSITPLFDDSALNGSNYPGKFAATLVSAPDFMAVTNFAGIWKVQFKPTQDIELTGNITFAVDQEAIRIPIEFVPVIFEVAFTVGTSVNITPQTGTYFPAILGGLSISATGLLTGIAAVTGTYTFWQTSDNNNFACLRVTILETKAILDIYTKPNTTNATRQIFPVNSDLETPSPFINSSSGPVVMQSVSLAPDGLLTWTTGSLEGNFQFSIPSQDIIINFVVANPIVYDTTTVYLNSDSIFATVDVESGCQQIINGVVQSASAKLSEVFGQIACNYTGNSPLTITGQPPSTAVVKIGKSTITVKRWPTLMPIVHKTKGPFDTYSFGIVPASATLNVEVKMKFTTSAIYRQTMSTLNEQDDGIGQVPYIISNSTGIFLRYGPETSQNIDVVIRVEGNTATSPDTIYAFSLIVSDADYLARVNRGDQYLVGGQVARMTPAQFVAMGAIPLPNNVEGLFAPYNTGYYKGQLLTGSTPKLRPDAIRYIEMPPSWQNVGNSPGSWYYIGGTLIRSSAAGVISPTTGPTQAEARDGALVIHRVDIETLRKVVPPGQNYEGAQSVPPSYIFEGVTAVPSGFIRRNAHLLETQNAIYDFSSGLVSLKTKNPISDMIEVIVQDSTYYTHYKLAVALNVMQPKPLTITYKGTQTHVDIRNYIPYTLTNIIFYDKDYVVIAYDPTMPIIGEPIIYYEGTMSSGVLIRGKVEFVQKLQ